MIDMYYSDGDLLLYKSTTGKYSTIVTDIPNISKVVLLDFVQCTDVENNNYTTVAIGLQIWMAENLKYLPSVVGPEIGWNTTPYYYVYGYNGTVVADAKATDNYINYGVLYNWPAAKNACPAGWHLPNATEWTELTDYLGGESIAGGKLKEIGFTHWVSPNIGATNESGFSALAGGYRSSNSNFYYLGAYGYWWPDEEYCTTCNNAWSRYLMWCVPNVTHDLNFKEDGHSVRCIKD